MKKFYSILLFCCLFATFANAQYYYYKGNRIDISVDSTKLSVITSGSIQLPSISGLSLDTGVVINNPIKRTVFAQKPSNSAYNSTINTLKSTQGVKRVLPLFKRGNNPIEISDVFYVKLQSESDYALLQSVAQQKSASIQVSDLQNIMSVSYPLSTTLTQQDISLSGFVPGNYIVKLIISGAVVDTKSLIIY